MSKKLFRVVWSDWRLNLSIGAKTLIAFLLITAVLTGGFYYFVSVKFSAHVHRDALKELKSNLQGAWSLYQTRVEQMKYGMLQAASADSIKAAVKRGDSAYLRRILNDFSGARSYVDLWAVVGPDRTVIARRNGSTGDFLEINGIVGKALASGQPVMSTELVARNVLLGEGGRLAADIESSGLMQLVVVPVVDKGATTGAFVTGILLNGRNWLPDTIYRYFSVNAAVLSMPSKDGLRVVNSTSIPDGIFSPLTELDQEISSLLPKTRGFFGTTELGSKRVILAIEPIVDFTGTPIGALAVADSHANVEEPILEVKSQVLTVAAIGLVFSIFLAALTYRDTHKPVQAIRGAMKETASGNLDVGLEIRTKDEFETIGQGFNSMVRSIKVREERLAGFNRISKVLLEFSDPDLLLSNALSNMAELTGSQIGAIYLYDEDTGVLKPETCCGISDAALGKLKKGEGLAGRCLAEQKTMTMAGDGGEGLFIDTGVVKVTPGGLAWFCLSFNEKPRGVLLMGSVGPYAEEKIEHMEQLVNQIAIALDNAIIRKEIEKLSVTDHLTGVFNRRRFSEVLSNEFKASFRYKYDIGVVMIDVDDFKSINDTYGHKQGDIVLSEISKVLKDHTRTTDVWARYGGEEFVGLVTHSNMEGVSILAEKLRKAVEAHQFTGLTGRQVTISLGVGFFPFDNVRDVDDIMRIADENLYKAKRNGKNQVVMPKAEEQEKVKLVRS